jgi:HSP20 family protein
METLMRTADRPVLSLREAMDRLLAQSFTPFFQGDSGYQHVPTNLWEDQDNYYLYLLVPGVDPSSVEITTVAGTLTIAGQVTPPAAEGAKAIWQEWGPVQFRRQFQLANGFDADQCHATYRDGVLMVTVPKPEQSKPKSIKIQIGAAGSQALPANGGKKK